MATLEGIIEHLENKAKKRCQPSIDGSTEKYYKGLSEAYMDCVNMLKKYLAQANVKNEIVVYGHKLTTEEFIRRAREVHGDKYDYSKVEYVNSQTKVCIICPKHGPFWQIPNTHLGGSGCAKCYNERRGRKKIKSTEEFIREAREVHGDKYDYSKVEYSDIGKEVCIICPKHGKFWQSSYSHLNGSGCAKCYYERINSIRGKGTEEFIREAREVHGDKYDYSKVEYVNTNTKVCIICPKHGPFWQTPNSHLQGSGCQMCAQSKIETNVLVRLCKENIKNIYQYRSEWLGKQSIDFFLEDKNIAIECQGLQHYKAIDFFGGEENFHKQQERDIAKKKLCEENGIKLYYYSDVGETEFLGEKVYNNLDDLINEIKKC